MFNSVDSVLSLIDAWIQGTEKKLEGVIIAANCKETPVTFDSVLMDSILLFILVFMIVFLFVLISTFIFDLYTTNEIKSIPASVMILALIVLVLIMYGIAKYQSTISNSSTTSTACTCDCECNGGGVECND